MKHTLFVSLVLVLLVSCQKEISIRSSDNAFVSKVYEQLRDSLPVTTFSELDWKHMVRSRPDSSGLAFLRIGFLKHSFGSSFVLVRVSTAGKITKGTIVEIHAERPTLNGHLKIRSLKGEISKEVSIVSGYERTAALTRSQVQPAPEYKELPAVIVTGSYSSGGGFNWSTWYSLSSFLSEGGMGGSGWYNNADPFGGGGGGGVSSGGTIGGGNGSGYPGNGNGNGGVPYEVFEDDALQIDFEQQYNDPAIDLQKFINCFNAIPDAGATCKITIYTDVPVDSDPTRIMNWESGSPGHTWIQLQKKGAGGSSSASQHIGFYPKTGWKTIVTPAALPGKFVDNGGHELNASYEVSITPAQLQSALSEIMQRRNMQYDIENNNCTDWGLQVMKAAIGYGSWFEIPKFNMPGGLSPTGTNTPQGLYVKIKEMQTAGTAGADVPIVGWAGVSTGPCN